MTAAIVPVSENLSEPTQPRTSLVRGIVYGLIASTIGGAFLAYSRAGLSQTGLGPAEIAFLRYSVAGTLFLPWLIRNRHRCRAALSVFDVLVYVMLLGPPFVLTGVSGYLFAPLVHGAVFLPGSLLVFGTAISALFLGEPLSRVMIASVLVICFGFLLIAAPGFVAGDPAVLAGDALFLCAGAQWSAFAVLVGWRRIDPLMAVASLSVLSLIVYCPLYIVMFGTGSFAALSAGTLFTGALVHGLLAGAIAVLSYSLCIAHLGTMRASLFPALVPVLTLVIGIPLTGEWLTPVEWAAVAIIVGGLLSSVRIWERWRDFSGRQGRLKGKMAA